MVTAISQFHVLTFVLATVLLRWWDTVIKSTDQSIWSCLQYQGDSMAIMVGNMAAGRKALWWWSSWDLHLQAAAQHEARCAFETAGPPSFHASSSKANTYSFLNNSPAGNPMFKSVRLWAFPFQPLHHLQPVAVGILIPAIPAIFKW